jgi:uncharacterized protein YqjF (DUF2071 family)
VRDSEGTPGVVFLRDLCPSRIGCILGRFLFNEKFQLCPTSFEIEAGDGKQTARYSFGKGKASSHLQIVASVRPSVVKAESEEAFVSQRYFGFSRQRDGSTLKFEVVHRPWVVYSATDVSHSVAAEPLYGKDLAGFLSGRPTSAFIMDGSAVEVLRHGRF